MLSRGHNPVRDTEGGEWTSSNGKDSPGTQAATFCRGISRIIVCGKGSDCEADQE